MRRMKHGCCHDKDKVKVESAMLLLPFLDSLKVSKLGSLYTRHLPQSHEQYPYGLSCTWAGELAWISAFAA